MRRMERSAKVHSVATELSITYEYSRRCDNAGGVKQRERNSRRRVRRLASVELCQAREILFQCQVLVENSATAVASAEEAEGTTLVKHGDANALNAVHNLPAAGHHLQARLS